MHQGNIGGLLQQHHGQMGERAVADGAVSDAVRLGLGRCDQPSEINEGTALRHGDHIGRGAEEQDRVQILLRIITEIGHQRRGNGKGVEDIEEGLPIRRRLGDG
jgi:hypothetical protein